MRSVPRALNQVDAAARHATNIFKAVVERSPPPPAPGGMGVDAVAFGRALPWLRWRELVVCARHFGRRRAAVEDIAAQLAVECGHRMADTTSGTSSSSTAPGAVRSPAALVDGRQQVQVAGGDVVGIVCAFAKLQPQSVEYGPLYAAVMNGVKQGLWRLERLNAAMLATALADVGMRLSDVHEELLGSILSDIQAAAEDDGETLLTVDELRYLVHACSHLSSEHASGLPMEALARETKKSLESANFGQAVHMLVSWLRLSTAVPPCQESFDIITACSQRLHHQRPQRPSHNLPAAVAPLLEALLAPERQLESPPVTPPLVQAVVYALIQMSKAVYSASQLKAMEHGIAAQMPTACFADGVAIPSSESEMRNSGTHSTVLDFRDWVRILAVVINFCNAHTPDGAAFLQPSSRSTQQEKLLDLPRYAGEALSFVANSTLLRAQDLGPADMDSMLTFLHMLRTYRSLAPPTEAIYQHMARRLVANLEAAGDLAPGEHAKLGFLMEELVPYLPEAERQTVTRRLAVDAAGAQAAVRSAHSASEVQLQEMWTTPSSLRLSGQPLKLAPQPSSQETDAMAPGPVPSPLTAQPLPAAGAGNPLATSAAILNSSRLWAMLRTPLPAHQVVVEVQDIAERAPAAAPSYSAATSVDSPAADARVLEARAPQADSEVAASIRDATLPSEVEELQATVKLLLDRIQTLEAKVSKREREADAQEKVVRSSAKAHDASAGGAKSGSPGRPSADGGRPAFNLEPHRTPVVHLLRYHLNTRTLWPPGYAKAW
mmetsp:Transcript_15705/g.36854  ORF Transcript_15705/g.36854 Transcript_15705/m.36854 type:complete len:776 (+) Transcript_15705:48-2375(+)